MKKRILLLFLSAQTIVGIAQQTDEISFFKIKNDTVTFFLDKVGDITTKVRADFYRTTCMDSLIYNYSGEVKDYYIGGPKAYECTYSSNSLNGRVISYFNNGQIQYQGYFKNSLRDSSWYFYYDNGVIEKHVNYLKDFPFLMECNKKNGNIIFADGNGKYTGNIKIVFGNNQPVDCVIRGSILNGTMDGKWNWKCTSCQGNDYFENGNFIKSETYTGNSTLVPRMVSLSGFDLHENVNVFKFIAIPRDNYEGSMNTQISNVPVPFESSSFESQTNLNSYNKSEQQLRYKKSNNLNNTFSKELIECLLISIKKNQPANFWCFVEFVVQSNNNLDNIIIHSNNSEISNTIHQFLSGIKDFETIKSNDKSIPCDVYLSFYLENNKLYIPDYNFNNLGINPFNLIQEK
jgi:hypothetical protein